MQSVRQFGLAFLACLSIVLVNASWASGESAGDGNDSRGTGRASSCTDQQFDCARYEGDDSTDRADYPDYPDNDVDVLSDTDPIADTGSSDDSSSSGESSPPGGGVASGGGAMAETSTSLAAFVTLSGVFALAALASAVARRVLG